MSAALKKYIKKAQAVFTSLSTGNAWEDNAWDTTQWLPSNTVITRRQRLVFGVGHLKTRGAFTSLPKPFGDFAKAMAVMLVTGRNLNRSRLRVYLHTLRLLGAVLLKRGTADPTQIRPSDLQEVIASQQHRKISPGSLESYITAINVIAVEMDENCITNPLLHFKQPWPFKSIPKGTRGTRGPSPTLEERESPYKLPSMEAIAAYAHCSNNPIDDSERMLLRTCDLQIILGNRIHETLLLPKKCWIEETVKGSDGRPLRHPASNSVIKRYGIRFYPGKGYRYMINWLPDQDVEFVKRAIDELTVLCEPARKVAKWLESNPGRLWPHDPDDLLTLKRIQAYFPRASTTSVRVRLWMYGIKPVQKAGGWGQKRRQTLYRAGDIEKTFPPDPNALIAVCEPRGNILQRLSDCLCVKFEGQFNTSDVSQNNLRPSLIMYHDIQKALGGPTSIFARRNIKENDGAGNLIPIRINTHSTRHWKNTLYDLGGMSDLQQTWAMHRSVLNQTATYQHRTLVESTSIQRNFLDLSLNEKTRLLRNGIQAGTIQGPLTQTYHALVNNQPGKAEDFLRTHAVGIQITPWGICGNDFTLAPCPKYLQCYDNCKHYHRTLDSKEEQQLRDFRTKMVRALGVMRGNASGEAGGDKWVKMLEAKIANIDHALAIPLVQIEQMKSVPVFPDGVDKSKPRTRRRTAVD